MALRVDEQYMDYLDKQITGGSALYVSGDTVVDTFDEGDPNQTPRFTIDDDGKADWAIRKIAQAQQRMAEREQFVQVEVDRLKDWKQKANDADQRSIAYMTDLLQSYFDQLRNSGALGKKKSYKLPHGALKVRTKNVQYAKNDDVLMTWAEENRPEIIERKPSIKWGVLKADLEIREQAIVDKDTGKVLDGVQLVDGHTAVDAEGNIIERINVMSGMVVVDKHTGMVVQGLAVATPAGEEFSVDIIDLTEGAE